MERTDIERDDYFPAAKHAARTPTSLHLASPSADGTSNGRASSAQLTRAGAAPNRGLLRVGEDGPTGSTDLGASRTDVDRVSAMWHARYGDRRQHSGGRRRGVPPVQRVGGRVQLVFYRQHHRRLHPGWLRPGRGPCVQQPRCPRRTPGHIRLRAHSGGAPSRASPSTLSSHLSSGTLSSQNLIQITSQGPTKDDALRWVQATTTAFVAYLAERARSTSSSLRNSIAAQTKTLTQQIALLQFDIDNTPSPPAGSTALTNSRVMRTNSPNSSARVRLSPRTRHWPSPHSNL